MTSYETIERTKARIEEIMATIRELNKGNIYTAKYEEQAGTEVIDETEDGKDLVAILANLEGLQQEIANIKSKISDELTAKMEAAGITQISKYQDGKSYTYIYKPALNTIRFDLEGLKRDYPKIYEKYHTKATPRKALVQIQYSDWQTLQEWNDTQAQQFTANKPTSIANQSKTRNYQATKNAKNVMHAADRGTFIHSMAEKMAWNGWEIPDEVSKTGTSWLALDYLRDIMVAGNAETKIAEQPGFWCGFGGKVDWFGSYKGKNVLIDWKTEERQETASWTIQLNAYRWMLTEQGETVDEMLVVWLPLKGSGQVIPIQELGKAETLQRLRISRP